MPRAALGLGILLMAGPATPKKFTKGPPRHLIIEAPTSTPMYQNSQGASIPPPPRRSRTPKSIW